jgi:hypothetical protein
VDELKRDDIDAALSSLLPGSVAGSTVANLLHHRAALLQLNDQRFTGDVSAWQQNALALHIANAFDNRLGNIFLRNQCGYYTVCLQGARRCRADRGDVSCEPSRAIPGRDDWTTCQAQSFPESLHTIDAGEDNPLILGKVANSLIECSVVVKWRDFNRRKMTAAGFFARSLSHSSAACARGVTSMRLFANGFTPATPARLAPMLAGQVPRPIDWDQDQPADARVLPVS